MTVPGRRSGKDTLSRIWRSRGFLRIYSVLTEESAEVEEKNFFNKRISGKQFRKGMDAGDRRQDSGCKRKQRI